MVPCLVVKDNGGSMRGYIKDGGGYMRGCKG